MIHEFEQDYLGFGRVRSRCNIRMFSENGEHLFLFEDINLGTSVTNASEQLATQMVAMFHYKPENCRFFETYREYDYDSVDEIEYSWSSKFYRLDKTEEIVWEAKYPKWKPAPEMREKFRL